MNKTYWNGLGLPPVGVICEVQASHIQDGYWTEVEILAHAKHDSDDALLVCQLEDGCRADMDGVIYAPERFRPIRTQEQIEAEEREKAAKVLFEFLNPDGKWHKFHEGGKELYRSAVGSDLWIKGEAK